jgi:hypothetical protein
VNFASKLPFIGDRSTRMLDGTLEVRNAPATVVVITEMRSIPLSFAYLNAASSVRRLEST